jgi:hypothetical protein
MTCAVISVESPRAGIISGKSMHSSEGLNSAVWVGALVSFICFEIVGSFNMPSSTLNLITHRGQELRHKSIASVGLPTRKRSSVFDLRGSFLPPKDLANFAKNPDHPVLKDPTILVDRQTQERVVINHAGAQVMSYISGGKDVFATRPDAVLDGSKPIAGGVPICFPQFGPGPIQQHGFARNLKWDCLDSREESASGNRGFSYSRNNARAVYELLSTKETLSMWPHKFNCQYMVDLSAGTLRVELRVINYGDTNMTFTAALHTYFAVEDIDKVRLLGEFKGPSALLSLQSYLP